MSLVQRRRNIIKRIAGTPKNEESVVSNYLATTSLSGLINSEQNSTVDFILAADVEVGKKYLLTFDMTVNLTENTGSYNHAIVGGYGVWQNASIFTLAYAAGATGEKSSSCSKELTCYTARAAGGIAMQLTIPVTGAWIGEYEITNISLVEVSD